MLLYNGKNYITAQYKTLKDKLYNTNSFREKSYIILG